MDTKTAKAALRKLGKAEGMTLNEMLEEAVFDGTAQCVCVNSGCQFTKYAEPDARDDGQHTRDSPTARAGLHQMWCARR